MKEYWIWHVERKEHSDLVNKPCVRDPCPMSVGGLYSDVQCIKGNSHMGTLLNRITDRTENITFLPLNLASGNKLDECQAGHSARMNHTEIFQKSSPCPLQCGIGSSSIDAWKCKWTQKDWLQCSPSRTSRWCTRGEPKDRQVIQHASRDCFGFQSRYPKSPKQWHNKMSYVPYTNLFSYLGYCYRLSSFELFDVLRSFYFAHVLLHLLQVLHIFSQFLAVMFSFHDILCVLYDVILVVSDETSVTNVSLKR